MRFIDEASARKGLHDLLAAMGADTSLAEKIGYIVKDKNISDIKREAIQALEKLVG